MTKSFPSDFYVTCATVIPVLFLAVAVQGRAFESLVKTAQDSGDLVFDRTRGRTIWNRAWEAAANTISFVSYPLLLTFAILIPIAGGIGEFLALLALYKGSEGASTRPLVLISTLILLAAVVAGPMLFLLRGGANDGSANSSPPDG